MFEKKAKIQKAPRIGELEDLTRRRYGDMAVAMGNGFWWCKRENLKRQLIEDRER